jgi:hypothetical protein
VAKNIVAAGLAKQCQIQVAYAIGVARPMNVTVYTEGTGVIPDEKIARLVMEHFDLRPKGIIQMLDLLRPIYEKTAAYGHFGREEPEFTLGADRQGRRQTANGRMVAQDAQRLEDRLQALLNAFSLVCMQVLADALEISGEHPRRHPQHGHVVSARPAALAARQFLRRQLARHRHLHGFAPCARQCVRAQIVECVVLASAIELVESLTGQRFESGLLLCLGRDRFDGPHHEAMCTLAVGLRCRRHPGLEVVGQSQGGGGHGRSPLVSQ